MRRIMNGLVGLVVAGLLVALLREFNWDPFAVIEWAAHRVWSVIDGIASLFNDNETFQKVTEEPK